MSFADDLGAEKRLVGCSVCIWYEQLEPEDKAAFDEAAETREPGDIARIWRVATKWGLTCNPSWFREHLRNHHEP